MTKTIIQQIEEKVLDLYNKPPTLESAEELAEIMSKLDNLTSIAETELSFLFRRLLPEAVAPERIFDDLRNSKTFHSNHERQLRTLEFLFNELGGDKPEISFGYEGMVNVYWEKNKFTWLIYRTSLAYPAIKVTTVLIFDNKPPVANNFRFAKHLLEYTRTVL